MLARLEHDLALPLGRQRRLDGSQDVRGRKRSLRYVGGRDESDLDGAVV